MPSSIRRASRVLVPSRHVAASVIDYFPEADGKLAVAPLGVDRGFRPLTDSRDVSALRSAMRLPRRYLLFVGNLDSRKNLDVLEKAFALLADDYPDLELVICGQGRAGTAKSPTGKWRERVRYMGYVSAKDLPKYYQLAEAFVFPSIDEGFGLPVLEAMSCGCPVVCGAKAPAEFAGRALIIPGSNEPSALAGAVGKLLNHPARYREKVRQGRSIALDYSWSRTADAVIGTYRECLDGFLRFRNGSVTMERNM